MWRMLQARGSGRIIQQEFEGRTVSHPLLPLQFPQATNSTLLGLAGVLVALFGGAIAIEILRKRFQRRRILDAEWQGIHDLVTDRKLSERQRDVLLGMVRRHGGADPLSLLTVRQRFDQCVERELQVHIERGDLARFQELGSALNEIRVLLSLDYIAYGRSIQSSRELRPGQPLWVGSAADGPKLLGMIASADEAFFKVVLKDQQAAARIALEPGATGHFRLWREDDGRYQFETPLNVGKGSLGAPYAFMHTSKLLRIQERCHYRVHCDFDTVLELLTFTAGPDSGDRRVPARIVSLSAGGFAGLTRQTLPLEGMLRLALPLPGERGLDVEARLVGSQSLGGGRFILRGQFLGSYQGVQEAIARYVAKRQQPSREGREEMENF